jgi:hypothetical protein
MERAVTGSHQDEQGHWVAELDSQSGDVVDVRPLGPSLATTLVKSKTLEILRLVVPAGKEIPCHDVPGEIVVQCLEGSDRLCGFDSANGTNPHSRNNGNDENPLSALRNSRMLHDALRVRALRGQTFVRRLGEFFPAAD